MKKSPYRKSYWTDGPDGRVACRSIACQGGESGWRARSSRRDVVRPHYCRVLEEASRRHRTPNLASFTTSTSDVAS